MGLFISLIAIVVLILIPWAGAGVPGLQFIFGIALPYIALAVFIIGIIARILKWASSPVPFRITTTAGQEKSLPWIRQNKLDNPSTMLGVLGRMALEVFFFRSLFRNTKASLKDGKTLVYGDEKWLWLFSIAFHYSFLIIFLRHFRFFTNPVPSFVPLLQGIDGFFQVGLPIVYVTNVIVFAALLFLFFRRLVNQKVKYISLASDYFPLLLIVGIAATGILMRYFLKPDLITVKDIAYGILSFNPPDAATLTKADPIFYIHFFLVSILLIYFPMSKLVHMSGIFMSPTRNLANNNRMKHHENPWNSEFKMHHHTYQEYEDEFREVMKGVGLPLDKED